MIISLLFDSIFLGFAWYSILLVINKKFIKSLNKVLNDTVDNSAIHLVRYTGLLFFIYSTFSIVNFIINSEDGSYARINSMFGHYSFGLWIYIFACFVLTQLLWVRRIKANKAVRLLIALILLFILSAERLVIIITSLRGDYLGNSWPFMKQELVGNVILNWLKNLLIFAILVSIMNFFLQKKKHRIIQSDNLNAD